MLQYLLVTFTLLAVTFATPLFISECGTLDSSFTTYKLAGDIAVKNINNGFICFNIIGQGITLDGNGYELSSASNNLLPATAVQYSANSATVTNMRISNFRTGIDAKGKFGVVYNNIITRGTNGIDVSAINNRIINNVISDFYTIEESTSGIYVYFPAATPVDSYVNITNNIIFNIKGDNFAQGISVYFANFVSIGYNRIYDIEGALLSQDIASIESAVDTFSNVFTAPFSNEVPTSALSAVVAVALVLASILLLRSPSSVLKKETVRDMQELQNEKKEEEKQHQEKEGEEDYEMDGADVVPMKRGMMTATFHDGLRSSSSHMLMSSSSNILRSSTQ